MFGKKKLEEKLEELDEELENRYRNNEADIDRLESKENARRRKETVADIFSGTAIGTDAVKELRAGMLRICDEIYPNSLSFFPWCIPAPERDIELIGSIARKAIGVIDFAFPPEPGVNDAPKE